MLRVSFVRLHVLVDFNLNLINITEINIALHLNLWKVFACLEKFIPKVDWKK